MDIRSKGEARAGVKGRHSSQSATAWLSTILPTTITLLLLHSVVNKASYANQHSMFYAFLVTYITATGMKDEGNLSWQAISAFKIRMCQGVLTSDGQIFRSGLFPLRFDRGYDAGRGGRKIDWLTVYDSGKLAEEELMAGNGMMMPVYGWTEKSKLCQTRPPVLTTFPGFDNWSTLVDSKLH